EPAIRTLPPELVARPEVGVIRTTGKGRTAEVVVDLLAPLTGGKVRRLKSRTWRRLVRAMPCAICGKGFPFYQGLQLADGQSDPNHYPGRGRAGGGSDLETHPACRRCHDLITDHKISGE